MSANGSGGAESAERAARRVMLASAEEADLGRASSFHHWTCATDYTKKISFCVLIVGGVAGIVACGRAAVGDARIDNLHETWFIWFPLIAILSFVTLMFGLSFAILFLTPDESVSLHTGGFVYRQGNEQRVLPWSGVRRAVFLTHVTYLNGLPLNTTYAVTVEPVEGRIFMISNNVPEANKIGQRILEAVSRQRAEALLAKLMDGESFTQHGITITSDGVTDGGPLASWDTVDRAGMDDGELIIYRGGKKFLRRQTPAGADTEVFAFVAAANVMIEAVQG